MQYLVVQKQTVPELVMTVNEFLRQGYFPIGGIQFDKMNHPTQSLMLHEELIEPKKTRRNKTND